MVKMIKGVEVSEDLIGKKVVLTKVMEAGEEDYISVGSVYTISDVDVRDTRLPICVTDNACDDHWLEAGQFEWVDQLKVGCQVVDVTVTLPGTIKQVDIKGSIKIGRPAPTKLREAANAVRKARQELDEKLGQAKELGLTVNLNTLYYAGNVTFTYTPQEEKY